MVDFSTVQRQRFLQTRRSLKQPPRISERRRVEQDTRQLYYNPTTGQYQTTKPTNPYEKRIEDSRKALAEAWGTDSEIYRDRAGSVEQSFRDEADAWNRAAASGGTISFSEAYRRAGASTRPGDVVRSAERRAAESELKKAALAAGLTEQEYNALTPAGKQGLAEQYGKFGLISTEQARTLVEQAPETRRQEILSQPNARAALTEAQRQALTPITNLVGPVVPARSKVPDVIIREPFRGGSVGNIYISTSGLVLGSILGGTTGGQLDSTQAKERAFQERVETLRSNEISFFSGPADSVTTYRVLGKEFTVPTPSFERVERVARGPFTGFFNEKSGPFRDFLGDVSTIAMSAVPALPGFLYYTGGKLGATYEGLTISPGTRAATIGEYGASIGKTAAIFNPFTREGRATLATASFLAFLSPGAGAKPRAVVEAGLARISPKYVKTAPEGSFIVETTRGPVEVKVVGGIGSDSLPGMSLRQQALIAGQEIDAVSGQRGLFGLFEAEKVIEKPLPDPKASPLERSFFADPAARLRPSRLGIVEGQRTATLADIFRGEFSIIGEQPQAIIIPRTTVARFPADLESIRLKLLSNKPLTAAEQARFLEYQLTPEGQFKAVGFLSAEPEVTLAPGEVLVQVGRPGVTVIKGRKVQIIEAGIKNEKFILPGEKVLGGSLAKERPFNLLRSSRELTGRPSISRPVLLAPVSRSITPVSRDFIGVSTSAFSAAPSSRTPISPAPSGTSIVRNPSNPPIIRGGPSTPPSPPPTIRGPPSPPPIIRTPPRRVPPRTPPRRTPPPTIPRGPPDIPKRGGGFVGVSGGGFISRVPEFEALVRRKGKFFLVAKGTRSSALSKGITEARQTLAATVRIRPTGRLITAKQEKKVELSGFRGYIIKKGKKIPTPNQFIQRREKRLSSLGERREIKAARNNKGFFKKNGGVL